MNRRDFGKTALAVAAAALVTPSALAAEPQSIIDCVVIDYTRNRLVWRLLKQPDFEGHRFVYEDTGSPVQYRHFEFLRSDGLVVGASARMAFWTTFYDAFENEVQHMEKAPTAKAFTHAQFMTYIEEVRAYFNGRIVPIDQLG
jgi:hypothetical protein